MTDWLKKRNELHKLLHRITDKCDSTFSNLDAIPRKQLLVIVKFKLVCLVTLTPSLRTLNGYLYLCVASQLPSMLRQWYNTLDRHTCATLTRHAAISETLLLCRVL